MSNRNVLSRLLIHGEQSNYRKGYTVRPARNEQRSLAWWTPSVFCRSTFILRLANSSLARLADNKGCHSTGVGLDGTTRAVKHDGND
jgi:hypothetical protein